MTNVIELRNVSWRRAQKTLLTDINWEVKQDEHWAMLGLNGSGKTSLLNLLTGYSWPTTGDVRVLGHCFGETDIRKLRQSIGWVSSSLQARIKGSEWAEDIVVSGRYASIGLAYQSPTQQDFDKAYYLMRQLQCSHLIGRTYQTCSQGERQKLLIARGLMPSPALLLLDGPTNGLDFLAREALLASIQRLMKQADAPTIILVTHHIHEVLPELSHTLLIRDGTIFDKGSSQEILTAPVLSRFYELPVQVAWHHERPWLTRAD